MSIIDYQPTNQTIIDYGQDVINNSFEPTTYLYDTIRHHYLKVTDQDICMLSDFILSHQNIKMYDFSKQTSRMKYINDNYKRLKQDLLNDFRLYQIDILSNDHQSLLN